MRVLIFIGALLIMLGGCAKESRTPLPQDVAQKFWSAMVEGDIKEAKSYTIRGRVEEPLFDLKLLSAKVEGARVINGRAFVPTSVTFAIPAGSADVSDCNATFDTELLKIEGKWLVDETVTSQNYDKALQNSIAECGSKILEGALKRGLENFEEVKKELQKSFMGVSKELQKSFRELQKELQESLKRIQKGLEEEPSELPKPQEEGEKI